MELKCAVQNYDWGKLGKESEVAQLATASKSFVIDDKKPYAELWMGTHVNGPSYVIDTEEDLSVWLQRNMDSLGSDVRKHFGDNLPFLFKVLSVGKALSIQAHPNKVSLICEFCIFFRSITGFFLLETCRRAASKSTRFV